MISRIYLIRHGKTDGNRNHWYYGATDLPLSDVGSAEICAYREKGIYPVIPEDADFYTTGLIRTDQTMEAIFGKHEHTAIPKLQEINFGKAECMTYDELKVFDNFEKWAWDTTGDERIADAETANEFHVRIHAGLEELLEMHHAKEAVCAENGKDAVSVVVCHGGVISCIMEKLFPAVCGSMWDWLPEPGFGYAVDFQNGEPYMYSKINDIGRLGLGIYRLPLRGRKDPDSMEPGQIDQKAENANQIDHRAEKARQIDHRAVKALFDTQMQRGHGYFELEFLAWPDENEARENDPNEPGLDKVLKAKNSTDYPGLNRILKAVRSDLVKRYDRDRYYLTAVIDASMLADAEVLIKRTGAGYLDRLAVCGIEKYYADYPEDSNIEPETLADKRINGPEEESGRPVNNELEAVWAELGRLKKEGLIKKGGLAFCGSATLLDDLLKDRQEIEYVELPVNYKMGFAEGDLAQKYYTISRRRYKEILVRSPFAGGELAHLAKATKAVSDPQAEGSDSADDVLRKTMAGYAMLKKDTAPRSAVDWALRYVLSFPFVVTCVASTGDPEHAAEDMDAAERFRPLNEEEREKLKQMLVK